MELRPPTARKSLPNCFAHCKRSTKMKKYQKTIIPSVQNTMRTQVTPMVSNYGNLKNYLHYSHSTASAARVPRGFRATLRHSCGPLAPVNAIIPLLSLFRVHHPGSKLDVAVSVVRPLRLHKSVRLQR